MKCKTPNGSWVLFMFCAENQLYLNQILLPLLLNNNFLYAIENHERTYALENRGVMVMQCREEQTAANLCLNVLSSSLLQLNVRMNFFRDT